MAMFFAVLIATPASAALPTQDPSPVARAPGYCVILVGKAPSPTADSPVLYEHCSTKSMKDAEAKLRSAETQARVGTASSDLLMTWFQHADYNPNGGFRTNVYGGAGPCDTAGYRLVPSSYWQTNLSSAAGFAFCNTARFTNRALTYARTFRLPVPNLGALLNDNVGRIQVYRS